MNNVSILTYGIMQSIDFNEREFPEDDQLWQKHVLQFIFKFSIILLHVKLHLGQKLQLMLKATLHKG
jgi:hypothetical protein